MDNTTKFGTICKSSISRTFDGLRLKVDVTAPKEENAEFSQLVNACGALSPLELAQDMADNQVEWDVFREDAERLIQRFVELQSRKLVYLTAQQLRQASMFDEGDNAWHGIVDEPPQILQPQDTVIQIHRIQNRVYGAEIMVEQVDRQNRPGFRVAGCLYVNADVKYKGYVLDLFQTGIITGPAAAIKADAIVGKTVDALTDRFFYTPNPLIPPSFRKWFLVNGQEIPTYRYEKV